MVRSLLLVFALAPWAGAQPQNLTPPRNVNEALQQRLQALQQGGRRGAFGNQQPGFIPQQGVIAGAAQAWKAKGVVHSINRNSINIVATNQQKWRIHVSPQTAVKVTGKGGPELLRPGMLVKFNAIMTERNMITHPVDEISLIAATPDMRPGIGPPVDLSEDGNNVAPNEQGVEPSLPQEQRDLRTRAGRHANDRRNAPARGGDRHRDVRGAGRAQLQSVIGMVKSFRRGKFLIDAGDEKVRGELTPDAVVEARLNSHLFANAGDTISVEGLATPPQPNAPGEAMAQSIDIKLKPAKAVEERQRRLRRRVSAE